ncbi:hypothetical protein PV327_007416 [Microctonus hyperodae]|uniref:THAP-type domain-containing protein n=1 Tax=Microctonus hyperodae TaxID=165561 RepID=A0AA39FZW4_MICHY|nr:hypothetical protein PV327_007416 [Microctonus hyperodae]
MPAICSIINCSSGSDSGKRNDKKQLFKLPNDEERRQNWLTAIGNSLKEGRSVRKNIYICSHHFAVNCFLTEPTKILKDGQEIDVPRKRMALKKESVPSIFKVDSIDASQVQSDRSSNDMNVSASANQSSRKRKLSPLTLQDSNQVVNQTVPLGDAIPVKIIFCSPNNDRNCEKSVEEMPPTVIKNYSLQDLLNDWHSQDPGKLPLSWAINNTRDGLLFFYMGDIEISITRSILIKKDMSVEIKAYQVVAKIPVVEKITCLEDLREAMLKIVALQICEAASRGACKNGFFLKKPKSTSDRCRNCQIDHRRRTKNARRRERLLLNRKQNLKKNRRNIQRKYNRAIKKVEIIKRTIDGLMDRCSAISESSLEEIVKNLPPQMQETIKI